MIFNMLVVFYKWMYGLCIVIGAENKNPRANFKFQAHFFEKRTNPLLLTPSYRLNSRLESLSLCVTKSKDEITEVQTLEKTMK